MPSEQHFDVLVIGSGFGGSVTALRLTEKGYRVGVLEAGRRFADADHAKTSWALRDFVWAPRLGLTGVQRVHVLPDIVVLAGAGVGGGSLNYANTLYEPKSPAFYADRQWGHITDWREELRPYYAQAQRMLGVVTQPSTTPADVVMQKVAERMGVADSYGPTPVGVFYGRDGVKEPGATVPDPYFGGAGPARTGCLECGECMTGCRHGAKNTLVKNYLYLAEGAGAQVVPERTVTEVREREGGGFVVTTVRSTAWDRAATTRRYTADQVVVSAGTWGTQQLLHRMKAGGQLRRISDRLGHLTRTNSESLGGAVAKRSNPADLDFTQGVAITSSIHPDDTTHIEPCRYGKGSNAMGLLSTLATTPRPGQKRWLTWLGNLAKEPGTLVSLYRDINRWSERGIITLVMQSSDNSLTLKAVRRFGRTRVTSTQGHGEPNPTWIAHADTAQRLIAEEIDGVPVNSLGEIVDIPMTAHFLGGCAIGDSPETGVVDPYQRVYGHPGLHVVDGSTISANLGVNPSLTITAQAERAMALWPNKGAADPRPALGEAYQRVAPVRPVAPVVPADAPGALHLPIVEVRHTAPQPVSV